VQFFVKGKFTDRPHFCAQEAQICSGIKAERPVRPLNERTYGRGIEFQRSIPPCGNFGGEENPNNSLTGTGGIVQVSHNAFDENTSKEFELVQKNGRRSDINVLTIRGTKAGSGQSFRVGANQTRWIHRQLCY
jgi:hypothetical protein